jgi:hypothetical protein
MGIINFKDLENYIDISSKITSLSLYAKWLGESVEEIKEETDYDTRQIESVIKLLKKTEKEMLESNKKLYPKIKELYWKQEG